MMTSVFISTNEIQFVTGKWNRHDNTLNIQSVITEPLAEGAMINGMIANEFDVINCLERIKLKDGKIAKRKPNLIIDSSSILVKQIKAPILSNKKMIEIVKNEFLEVVENYEKLIYDYSILSIDEPVAKVDRQGDKGSDKNFTIGNRVKTGTIICSAIERMFVGSYIDVFKKAGFKIRSIDISLSSVIRLNNFLERLIEKSYILSIFEGKNLVSFLFSEKGYLLTNRTRLFSERGTRELFVEVSRSISSIIQFSQSNRSESMITDVFMCGLYESESEIPSVISETLNVNVGVLKFDNAVFSNSESEKYDLSSMIYVAGNLLRRGGI